MSFGIRATFKPRRNPQLGDTAHVDVPNHEETQEIIQAIHKFKSKSAHDGVLNSAERQTVLRKSSVNPDINPSARWAVESILRPKEQDTDADVDELLGPHDASGISGFSSLSISGQQSANHKSRIEKELAKEIEEIKSRHKRKPIPLPEIKEEDSADEKDPMSRLDAADLRDPRIANAFALSYQAVASTKTKVGPQTVQQEQDAERAYNTARRMVAMGHPPRAALARGIPPRNGGSSGASIRKTAMGMVDGF